MEEAGGEGLPVPDLARPGCCKRLQHSPHHPRLGGGQSRVLRLPTVISATVHTDSLTCFSSGSGLRTSRLTADRWAVSTAPRATPAETPAQHSSHTLRIRTRPSPWPLDPQQHQPLACVSSRCWLNRGLLGRQQLSPRQLRGSLTRVTVCGLFFPSSMCKKIVDILAAQWEKRPAEHPGSPPTPRSKPALRRMKATIA